MDILDMLKQPFSPSDIEWRACRSGVSQGGKPWVMALAYITNRAIMDRLDDVVGPANWRNEYTQAPCGGILCGLSIRANGEWVTKWDGAENTDVEAIKGGLSGSMKRAAVHWGIGRYLYGLTENFAQVVEKGTKGSQSAKIKATGQFIYWMPPQLPEWALPSNKRILREEMQLSLMAILQSISNDDRSTVDECYSELEEHETMWIWKLLSTKQKDFIRNSNQERVA